MSDSDFVEVVKRSGELKENYGKWWGGFITLSLANKAVGRRPLLWSAWIAVVLGLVGLALRYALPRFVG